MITVDPPSTDAHSAAPARIADGEPLAERVERCVANVPALMDEVFRSARERRLVDPQVAELVDDLAAQSGGKFVRARLTALAYLGLGGGDDAVLDRLITTVQLLHVSLCVHDDLLDGDPVRHGRPTIDAAVTDRLVGRFAPAQLGRQAHASALLAGNLALTLAFGELAGASAELSADRGRRLTAAFTGAVEAAIAGELLDLRGEAIPLGTGDPVRIAELKTAAYSVELPLRLGAIASCAGEHTVAVMAPIGRHLGIAYQLADDLLGVAGSADQTGKPTRSDLRRGKRTELVRHAYSLAGDDDRAYLHRWLGNPEASEDVLLHLRDILQRNGSYRHVRSLIDEHVAAADALAADYLPTELARQLIGLAGSLGHRDR